MKISVYLHQEYLEYLKCYGNIHEVTNKILEKMQDCEVESIPNAPARYGARRLNIDVTNEWYLEEARMRPTNSPTFSLRKILYFVVDNELPTEWGWNIISNYVNRKEEHIRKHLDAAISSLAKAQMYMSQSMREQTSDLENQIKYIRSQYNG